VKLPSCPDCPPEKDRAGWTLQDPGSSQENPRDKKKKQAKEVREAEVHSTLHTGSETVKASLIFWNLIESDQVPAMLASPHRGRLPSAHPAAICACQVERIKNHPHNRISIHLSPF
jgi:hypothetical protein